MVEKLYNAKKRIVKLYHDYLTIDGTYTSLLPDIIYLKKLYKKRMGIELNLKNPKTFNEKLQWLKLYDRNPEYTKMVDKYEVRDFVKAKIEQKGYKCSDVGLCFIPILGVWDSVDEVDFSSLPNQFVLKCNHDNGVMICKDKSKLDIEKIKKELEYRLHRNYYKKGREWPYKNVKRRIICETFMQEKNHSGLTDYKFFCFNGKVKSVLIVTDRFDSIKENYYTKDFVRFPFSKGALCSDDIFEKPKTYSLMIRLAELLAESIPHIRIDFYEINQKIYFGEMTLFDGGGFEKFIPEEWDYTFGNWIKLPAKRRR